MRHVLYKRGFTKGVIKMIKISQSPRILNTNNVSFASKVKEDKTNVSKENNGDSFEMQDKNNKLFLKQGQKPQDGQFYLAYFQHYTMACVLIKQLPRDLT